MAVPNIFGTATAAIPLSQLDSNFATTITLGNTAIQLGNTVTTLNNMTLANVTVSSGNVTLTNVSVTTANVTTANITTAVIGTATITTAGITTANATTANIVTAVITTANVTTANVSTALSYSGTLTGGTGIVNLGSGQFYKDASGNVGIGTASPSTYANGFAPVLVTGTGNNFAIIQGRTDGPSGSTNGVSYGGSYSTNPINGSRITFNAEGGSGQRGSVSFWTKALDDNSTQPLERMRIDSSGNVGINNTAPLAKLHVQGSDVAFTPDTNADFLIVENNGTSTIQIVASTTGKSELFFSDTTRNIGGYSYDHTSNFLNTIVNGSERMRIDSSGNVGIGTSSPIRKLTVSSAGAVEFVLQDTSQAANSRNWRVYNASNSLVMGTLNDAGTAGNDYLKIDSSGIVTMSAYGAGAATFSAAGVISSVSDETWKIKDGVPVDVDSMLNKLEPGYWYYNDEKKETFGSDRQLGFYAQNVNAAIGPEAAPIPEEGKPWGYYDRSVLAVTVMSLQKALATIESLTARIAALEST